MPSYTSKLQLAQPTGAENADIGVINANMTKLDSHTHGGPPDGDPVKAVHAGPRLNRPEPGAAGSMYVSTDTGELFFHNGTQWQLAASPNPTSSGSVPAGALMQYAGAAAPDGWLLCYGQQVSRTTYSALFSAIGTVYGVGDGLTTFNVPDLRGRLPLGADNMGGVGANRVTASQADNVGQGAGEESHALSANEMPAHNHGVNDPSHYHQEVFYAMGSGNQNIAASNCSSYGATGYIPGTGYAYTGISIQNAGGGGAHNNMPPYLTINYIIKT